MTDKRKRQILNALHAVYDHIRHDLQPFEDAISKKETEVRLQREKIVSAQKKQNAVVGFIKKLSSAKSALIALKDEGFTNEAMECLLKTISDNIVQAEKLDKSIKEDLAALEKPLLFDAEATQFVESTLRTCALIDKLEKTEPDRCKPILRELVRQMKLQCRSYPIAARAAKIEDDRIRESIAVRKRIIDAIQKGGTE